MTSIEDQARALAARAVQSTTAKIGGQVYTLTFDRSRWVYDVTAADGSHVVTFNTKKVTVARRWLREHLAA